MLFEVEFAIKVHDSFSTIHTAFIHALSVSECNYLANEMKDELPANKNHHIHIFIEAE